METRSNQRAKAWDGEEATRERFGFQPSWSTGKKWLKRLRVLPKPRGVGKKDQWQRRGQGLWEKCQWQSLGRDSPGMGGVCVVLANNSVWGGA